MSAFESLALVSVASFFPDRSARWVAENCRAGRIRGAVKVGKSWFLRAREADALVSAAPPSAAPLLVIDEAATARMRADEAAVLRVLPLDADGFRSETPGISRHRMVEAIGRLHRQRLIELQITVEGIWSIVRAEGGAE